MRTANDMNIILKLRAYKENDSYKGLEQGFMKESIKFCETYIGKRLEESAMKGCNFYTIQLGFGPIFTKHPDKVYMIKEDGYLCSGMIRSKTITGEPMDLTIIYKYLISHGYEVEINAMTYKMCHWGTLDGVNLVVKFPSVDFMVKYKEE